MICSDLNVSGRVHAGTAERRCSIWSGSSPVAACVCALCIWSWPKLYHVVGLSYRGWAVPRSHSCLSSYIQLQVKNVSTSPGLKV